VRASEIAERALLGAILVERERLADVQDWLEPEDFYAYRHGLVYGEILKLHADGQSPTPRAVLHQMLPVADTRRLVDGPFLHTLMESCPHPARAAIYGRMVLEASIHRRTTDRAEHLGYIAQSTSPADIVIDELAQQATDWARDLDALDERWLLSGGEMTQAGEIVPGPAAGDPPRIANEAAEVSAIASLLAHPRQMEQVVNWLRPEDFTRPDTRALYTAIADIAATGLHVDPVTVMWAAVRHEGVIERVGYEAVTRLASAGIPGYAAVSGRAVLEASLRNEVCVTASRVAAVGRRAEHRPAALSLAVRAELAYVATDVRRWPAASG